MLSLLLLLLLLLYYIIIIIIIIFLLYFYGGPVSNDVIIWEIVKPQMRWEWFERSIRYQLFFAFI